MTEDVCQRAGELRKYLDMDKQRMLRRMETFGEDQIVTDIWPRWRGILSTNLIHGILVREGMMQNYNQEEKRIINL